MTYNSRLKIFRLFVLVIIGGFGLFIISPSASAKTDVASWSWTDSEPVVFSSSPINDVGSTPCKTAYQTKDIAGEFNPRKVCFQAGSKINFGETYYSWGGFMPVVSFPNDNKMYKLSGVCGEYDSCQYVSTSDTMIAKQYIVGGYTRFLVVFRNFSKRLRPFVNGITIRYDFDASNPDYVFKSDSGYTWGVNAIALSGDNKWLAIEIMQRGIGLLNLETLEMKRISTRYYSYGFGMDSIVEMAISNDGKYVVAMGQNAGITIIDTGGGCGDEATDERLYPAYRPPRIATPCKEVEIDGNTLIHPPIGRFSKGIHPVFNDDGGELNFYAIPSYGWTSYELTLRANGYKGQRLDYLALGDSYTSGEGETDDKYYLPGTNEEFEKCHTSTRSYPYLIAKLSNIDPEYMRSVACSGAETKDIIGDDVTYTGQEERLGKDKLKMDGSDQAFAKTDAKYNFIPGRLHQETFVDHYKPKIITIGIGGNDAGLMSKLKSCAGPSTCNWATDEKYKEQTAKEIKSVYQKLVDTYKEISNVSPKSNIYAIGYPKIIDTSGDCDKLTGYLFDETERRFINESVSYLNQVVEAAAKASGIKYIDVWDSYGDQTLCGSKSPSAMNGVRVGDDNNLVNESNWFRFIGNEGFHPNYIGHKLVADKIENTVGNLNDYQYCGVGIDLCPDDTIMAPEPSSYWIPAESHNYPTQKETSFISDSADSTNNQQKQLITDVYSFTPGSTVEAMIYSEPKSLGQFVASSDGSLDVNIDLPNDLEEGYHTIRLIGTSYSGEPVELYQVILFKKPVVVPEKQIQIQPSFATASGKEPENDIFNGNFVNESTDKQLALSVMPEVKGVSTTINRPTTRENKLPNYILGIVVLASVVSILLIIRVWHKRKR